MGEKETHYYFFLNWLSTSTSSERGREKEFFKCDPWYLIKVLLASRQNPKLPEGLKWSGYTVLLTVLFICYDICSVGLICISPI